jgi:hypothetical protein
MSEYPSNNIEAAADACAALIVETLGENPEWMRGALGAALSICNMGADLGGALEAMFVHENIASPGDDAVQKAGEQVMLLISLTLSALTERLIVLLPEGDKIPIAQARVGAFIAARGDDA